MKMNKNRKAGMLRQILTLCLLWDAQSAVRAEDIDLFVGTPTSATDAPNVLIILDNTANWTTPFSNEMTALASVVNGLQVNKFRVGLMMFSETGGSDKGNDGAYVRAAMRLLDSSSKPKYQALVSSLGVGSDKSNGGKISKAMEEAWLYYSAGTPYSGNQKAKTDFTGNAGGTAASNAIYALSGNALSTKNGTTYSNPIVAGCAKNFIIYISNGAAQDNTADLKQATTALAAAGGSTTAIPISPSGSQDNMADEWARFMKKSPKSITTYTVDINKVTTGQGPGWTALLKSMANVSSGKYFDVTASGTQISDALNAIFSEIQATNSVFASVTLPLSVSSQSNYLNQVFVGMFRPDPDSFPRWPGNLKQYKVGTINGQLTTMDADSKDAINSATGFITECARSFWTPTSLDTYWTFKPQGNCGISGSDASNYPDGNIVEKGAQAYVLRQASSRNTKTCDPTTCTALTNFNAANTAITQALLGAADATERSNLINWAVGVDNQDENTNGNITEMRPSVHGDVVHSRPAAINYGTEASPLVVVYYGANDGLLRAINGNRSGNVAGVTPGSEIWSFMPPEFYPRIKRLRDNNVTISFPGHTTGTPTPQPKDYGMDGSVSVVQQGSNNWIYAGMRRGGRALYAFDVTTAASPTLKWKIGCPNLSNDTGCSTGFAGMGQSWATPVSFLARGYASGTSSILVMGGGYDNCEDADPNTCTSSSKGRHIYLLDANAGTLLKTFDTDRGVTGDVAMVKNSSGMAMFGYATDLGGNVYRISGLDANSPIGNTDPANWTITKIASLGCATVSTCSANRKFLYGPKIGIVNGQYLIMVGSGDREKPLLSYSSAASVANRFYAFRDKPSDASWLSVENTTCGSNLICNNSLLPIITDATPTNTQLAAYPKGWYLGMQSTEQVVTSALVLFNSIRFSTHQPAVPSSTSCSSLGTARAYTINYLNAAGVNGQRYVVIAGGGLPPPPVGGRVTLDDGTKRDVVFGGSGDSTLKGTDAGSATENNRPKSWVFWDIER
ncbi:pilus assembly protein [Pseudomonas sp. Pseusp97]|uniref:pilus assembly protein n=1 Tax=Pseudomonas sp. Pseusp97 TaxID=3243065 RepID=UPI0039A56A77